MAVITGTAGADDVYGGGENDQIDLLGGADAGWGGDGDDSILGGEGDDTLRGAAGNDTVRGGAGNDRISETVEYIQSNVYSGGAGDDYLYIYRWYGSTGSDMIRGDEGDDVIIADAYHSSARFTIEGGAGNDTISTPNHVYGADISGGDGDDIIDYVAGRTDHRIRLGAGADTIRLNSPGISSSNDATVLDFQAGPGGDRIDVSTYWQVTPDVNPFGSGKLRLFQQGADTLFQAANYDGGYFTLLRLVGVNAADMTAENLDGYPSDGSSPPGVTLTGGGGADSLTGTLGADLVRGLAGADTLVGGGEADTIEGGDDADVLVGSAGDDLLRGGAGNDTLNGSAGDDLIKGEAGDDVINGTGADGGGLYSEGGGDDTYSGGAGNDDFYIWRPFGGDAARLNGDDGDDTLRFDGGGQSTLDGGLGNDFLMSTGASSVLIGGEGDDTVDAGIGRAAVITLGAGRDEVRQHFAGSGVEATIITDFQVGDEGDVLALPAMLRPVSYGPFEENPFAYGLVRLVQAGADTLVQHRPYTGAAYVTWFRLENIAASSLTAVNLGGYAGDGSAPAGVTVNGGDADESVTGGIGSDLVTGGAGDDTLAGGVYFDTLEGGAGDDVLIERSGHGQMSGGGGNDSLSFWGSEDYARTAWNLRLDGGKGDDVLSFNSWRFQDQATMNGGAGADAFDIRASGQLMVNGGGGADVVTTQLGINYGSGPGWTLDGRALVKLGGGSDVIRFETSSWFNSSSGFAFDNIVVTDFTPGDGGDRIELYDLLTRTPGAWDRSTNPFAVGKMRLVDDPEGVAIQIAQTGFFGQLEFGTLLRLRGISASELTAFNLDGYPGDGSAPPTVMVEGTPANDSIVGGHAPEQIVGLAGGDILNGGAGDDSLAGGDGDDSLTGGFGGDSLTGGQGNDTLTDAVGADHLSGEGGDDVLQVARGYSPAAQAVTLDGGDGDDSIGFARDFFGYTADVHAVGGGGADTISISGASEALIEAGAGTDTVRVSLTERDYLVDLGSGADTLQLAAYYPYTLGSFTVQGFTAGDGGDRMHLRHFDFRLDGLYTGVNPFESGHFGLRETSRGTMLQIDTNGGGDNLVDVILLRGVEAADLTADNFDGFDPHAVARLPEAAPDDFVI